MWFWLEYKLAYFNYWEDVLNFMAEIKKNGGSTSVKLMTTRGFISEYGSCHKNYHRLNREDSDLACLDSEWHVEQG